MNRRSFSGGGTCIGVIGASDVDASTAAVARRVGEEIALRGGVLVCGGLSGVMEAAAEGARSRDGLTIGILPGRRAHEANRFISVAVVTGLGEARNAIIAHTSQAVIAIGGAYGTLSEIAFCLKLGVPVVGLQTWRLGHEQGDLPDLIRRAHEPAEAVALAFRLLEGKAL
ncbi:MAG: TIGR00725 family protein [Vulcanimicrobiota bacterium]